MKELKIIIWVSWRSRSGRRAIDRILSEDVYTEGQRHNFREVAMKRLFLILSACCCPSHYLSAVLHWRQQTRRDYLFL